MIQLILLIQMIQLIQLIHLRLLIRKSIRGRRATLGDQILMLRGQSLRTGTSGPLEFPVQFREDRRRNESFHHPTSRVQEGTA
jgi:hypothetical protein